MSFPGDAALDALFQPRSVAVIGASSRELSIGNRVVRNLVESGFTGAVHPINPRPGDVWGRATVPSLDAVDGAIDLAVVALPADRVPEALEACGRRGVRAAIVHAAGFAESGAEGAALERRCVAIARAHGLRLLGPNAQGVMNADPAVALNATFTFTPLRPGPVSVLAVSGGVGELVNQHLWRAGVGIRRYACPGNAADVGVVDLLDAMAGDHGTHVLVLHLETLPPVGPFLEAVARHRDRVWMLAVASGRTAAGADAVASHTGALARADQAMDAVLARAGVLRFDDTRELVQAAAALAIAEPPRGRRVAVLCNAGGPGILALDAAVEAGLVPADLSEATRADLARTQSPFAAVGAMTDVAATAGPEAFGDAVRAIGSDPGVDALLFALVTPFFVDCDALARRAVEVLASGGRPAVVALLRDPRFESVASLFTGAGLPVVDYPEDASRVLAAMVRARELRAQAAEVPASVSLDQDAVATALAGAARDPDGWLSGSGAFRVLEAAGIPCAPWQVVRPSSPWADLAASGLPLVLKADLPGRIHKSDAGAIVPGIRDPDAFRVALEALSQRFPGADVLAQPWVDGFEMMVGGLCTASGAVLVAVGAGGVAVESVADVGWGLAPLSMPQALRMIESLRCRPLLDGGRGAPAADVDALVALLARVAGFLAAFPEVAELDLNPVRLRAAGQGAVAVDARIRCVPGPESIGGDL
jgi:acetyltransferase